MTHRRVSQSAQLLVVNQIVTKLSLQGRFAVVSMACQQARMIINMRDSADEREQSTHWAVGNRRFLFGSSHCHLGPAGMFGPGTQCFLHG